MWAVIRARESSTPWGTAAAVWRCRFISAAPWADGSVAAANCRCFPTGPGRRCRGLPTSRRYWLWRAWGFGYATRWDAEPSAPRSRDLLLIQRPWRSSGDGGAELTENVDEPVDVAGFVLHRECPLLFVAGRHEPAPVHEPRPRCVEEVRVGLEEASVVHERLAPVGHAPLAAEVDDVRRDVVGGDGLCAPLGQPSPNLLEMLVGVSAEDLGQRCQPGRGRQRVPVE